MAAVTLASGAVNLSTNLSLPASTGALTQNNNVNIGGNINFGNGTAAGQMDILVYEKLTLSATPSTVDLSTINDVGGTSRSPLRCRFLGAYIDPGDTNLAHTVNVAPGASNPWANAPTTILSPGGPATALQVLCSDPQSVGSGVGAVIGSTNKTIKFDPGANTIVIWLVGCFCSAVS